MKVCIVGASGKLGQYMVRHALERGYEVVGVCRESSVPKLAAFEGRITVLPGPTDDPEVIGRAVAGCDGVLTVLAPWGVRQYASGTAQAVLDHARPGARLIFNLTRRVDFALFMVEALTDDTLVQEAPAIVGCRTPSALAHTR